MNELVKFLDSPAFERRVNSFFSNLRDLSEKIEKEYLGAPLTSVFGPISSFEEKDGLYTVTFPVAEDATAKNVNVDLEDGVLTVTYDYTAKNATSHMTWSETLPENADEETLEATVEDGVLTITAEVLPEPEEDEEVEEPEDTTRVRINRK